MRVHFKTKQSKANEVINITARELLILGDIEIA